MIANYVPSIDQFLAESKQYEDAYSKYVSGGMVRPSDFEQVMEADPTPGKKHAMLVGALLSKGAEPQQLKPYVEKFARMTENNKVKPAEVDRDDNIKIGAVEIDDFLKFTEVVDAAEAGSKAEKLTRRKLDVNPELGEPVYADDRFEMYTPDFDETSGRERCVSLTNYGKWNFCIGTPVISQNMYNTYRYEHGLTHHFVFDKSKDPSDDYFVTVVQVPEGSREWTFTHAPNNPERSTLDKKAKELEWPGEMTKHMKSNPADKERYTKLMNMAKSGKLAEMSMDDFNFIIDTMSEDIKGIEDFKLLFRDGAETSLGKYLSTRFLEPEQLEYLKIASKKLLKDHLSSMFKMLLTDTDIPYHKHYKGLFDNKIRNWLDKQKTE